MKVPRQAVMKLSPDHREIIDLVYYHEKSMIDAHSPRHPGRDREDLHVLWLQEVGSAGPGGGVSPIIFWGGVRRLWRKLGPPYPILSGARGPGGHIENFGERLTDPSV